MVSHAPNPRTLEVEAGESNIQGHHQLCNKSKQVCLKKEKVHKYICIFLKLEEWGLQPIEGALCVLCYIALGLMRPRVVERTMLISVCTLVFWGCGERGSYHIEKAGRLSCMVTDSQGKLQKWGLVRDRVSPAVTGHLSMDHSSRCGEARALSNNGSARRYWE